MQEQKSELVSVSVKAAEAQFENAALSSGEFQIYLSSTLDDLTGERTAAVEILRRHGRVVDSYRAGPQPTVTNCLSDVRDSQLYVLILGKRYGWVPDGESDPEAKSITELEYDACVADPNARIPRLVFVRTTNPDRFNDDEMRPQTSQRMRRFRLRAQSEQQAYTFDDLPQFTVALTEAVIRARQDWERARGAAPKARRATLHIAPWTTGQTVLPLPGYPVLTEGVDTVFTGGGVVNLVFSHDHASPHGIVVTNLVPEWSFEPLQKSSPVKYEIDGAALPPQGFFTPERFMLILAGTSLRGASWTTGQQAHARDADLLNTDPPRQILLDAQVDDTISLQGVVRVLAPGRYKLRWRIRFIVSGEPGEIATSPLHFVQAE